MKVKKLAWTLLGSILLTGCSTYQEVDVTTTTYSEEQPSSITYGKEEDEEVNSQAYYRFDDTILTQTKKVADAFNEKDNDNYYADSSGFRLEIYEEMFKENHVKPEESEWAERLDEIFPGIQDFMKKVSAEQMHIAPQHIVIQNATIKIKPAHLYKDVEAIGYNGSSSYMEIQNEPLILVDEYFKQLAQVVPKDKFVVHRPYVMGETQLLRFSTPSLGERKYVTVYNEQGKIDTTYYEDKAVGYQLFIEDNKIQKIRVIFNKIQDEEIDFSYFEPLLSWCENEWGMQENELEQVNELVEQVIEGKKGSNKGNFGNYEYSYRAKLNNKLKNEVIDQSEYKEMSIELVIEPKLNK